MPDSYNQNYNQQPRANYTPKETFELSEGFGNYIKPEMVIREPVEARLINMTTNESKFGEMVKFTFEVIINNEPFVVNYLTSPTYTDSSKLGYLINMIYNGLPPNFNVNDVISKCKSLVFTIIIENKRYPTVTNIIKVEDTLQTTIPVVQHTGTMGTQLAPQPQPQPEGRALYVAPKPPNQVVEPDNCWWCGTVLPANPQMRLELDGHLLHVDCKVSYENSIL